MEGQVQIMEVILSAYRQQKLPTFGSSSYKVSLTNFFSSIFMMCPKAIRILCN